MTGFAHSASLQNLVCCICNSPVSLETCNTDERGGAVHEECYVRETISKLRTGNAVHIRKNWLRSMVVRFQIKSA
jgi:hypothetical protein